MLGQQLIAQTIARRDGGWVVIGRSGPATVETWTAGRPSAAERAEQLRQVVAAAVLL